MSTLALPSVAEKTKIMRRSRVAVHPLLTLKRLLQLALIALVVVPIPSDDGPFKLHAPAVAQVKPTLLLATGGN